MASPKSTTLSSLTPSSGKHGIPIKHHHISMVVFFVLFLTIWALFSTFHPNFLLKDEDFLTGFNQRGGNADLDDKLLSDRGRTVIFVWSLVFAVVLTALQYFMMKDMY